MMKTEGFAVFILTHGRANSCLTDKTLRRQGYTGKIYYLIDDEDDQAEQYYENFGNSVLQFNKQDYCDSCDTIDSEGSHSVILFARNACFDVAKKLGVNVFLQLDDDYSDFEFRYPSEGKLKTHSFKNLDYVFDCFVSLLYETNALTVAFAQGGDFIGGLDNQNTKKALLRKAMNAFFFRTDSEERFLGRFNEDVNFYVLNGITGKKIFSLSDAMIVQGTTQKNDGGMTGAYEVNGTYVKSFYTVICSPASVKIKAMGASHYRIHHSIDWNSTVPKILNQKYVKKR